MIWTLAQVSPGGGLVWLILFGVLAAVGLGLLWLIMSNFRMWLQATASGAPVGFFSLIGMMMRRVNRSVIVDNRIKVGKAGLHVTTDQMEAYYLNGGRVGNVIDALIAANFARIPLSWDQACAIDRAGRDILDAVHTSVNPKVIDCPDPTKGEPMVPAVAQDGIQMKIKARITVRTAIERLVGGATEETIIARVGQGIVSAVGQATSYKEVLENPANISKVVLGEGLDAGTAFAILSVDIADVEVAENIGARLQADQAEADKRRFQAEAEKRRALAVAQEQEFKAEEQKNRALVVLAEADIPKAIADSFRSGNLGIMDYYRLRNIQADTSMRSSIAGENGGGEQPTKVR